MFTLFIVPTEWISSILNDSITLSWNIFDRNAYLSSVVNCLGLALYWYIQRRILAWPWNVVMGRSRSSKVAPIDTGRSYTTSYWSAIIVSIYPAPFSSYLTLNIIVTLKSRIAVTKCLFVFHRTVVSCNCIVFEIKRYILVEISKTFFSLHDHLETLWIIFYKVLSQTARVLWKKIAEKFNYLSRVHQLCRRHRQTDRQTNDRRICDDWHQAIVT